MSIYNQVEWEVPNHINAYYTDILSGDFSTRTSTGKAHWRQFCQAQQLPYDCPTLIQVHGHRVVEAPIGYQQQADAVFTTQTQTPCAVMTADCVPILLCDQQGKWVAAIHAGWRGLVQGVIYHCYQKRPHNCKLIAWIGPCICQDHYEVGEEVKMAFEQLSVQHSKHILPKTTKNTSEKKYYINLPAIATSQLHHLGVRAIFTNTRCTYDDRNLYSYRRNPQDGRIASMVWKN